MHEFLEGLKNSFLLAWEVWWALVLGFAISAIVQAWVPRVRIQRALGGSGPRPVALATGPGTASSARSYAAIALPARRLVRRGPQLPQRLGDAVEGDHDRLPAGRIHRPARQRLLQRTLHPQRATRAADHRKRDRRPDRRGAVVRVLGRKRSAGRRAV